jgi:hypothetical protein
LAALRRVNPEPGCHFLFRIIPVVSARGSD